MQVYTFNNIIKALSNFSGNLFPKLQSDHPDLGPDCLHTAPNVAFKKLFWHVRRQTRVYTRRFQIP